MNDELQKALAVMLQKTTQATEAGTAFLQAELPEVIRQLLMWKAVQSFIVFIVALTICIYLSRLSRKFFREHKEHSYDSKDMLSFFSGVGAFFSFIVAMVSTSWLMILIAPKVYLIEYAASLAK